MTDAKPLTGLALLRAPFPEHQISKLPKESRKQADERKNRVAGCMVWKCPLCGNAHHKDADHLDYVGHAALTDRLLDCDPEWNWEPVVMPGLPNPGDGMWIKLTVCGVSRIGFGDAGAKTGGDAIKEIIGDALRNAAMRFGAALDLWHKGDLHGADDEGGSDEVTPPAQEKPPQMPDAEFYRMEMLRGTAGVTTGALCKKYKVRDLRYLTQDQFSDCIEGLQGVIAQKAKAETEATQTNDDLNDSINF